MIRNYKLTYNDFIQIPLMMSHKIFLKDCAQNVLNEGKANYPHFKMIP
jgi:hypothetical protein